MRLHSGVADHGERVARRPALRIVIDNDVGHGLVLQQQASSARSGSHSSARPPQQSLARKIIRPRNASMLTRCICRRPRFSGTTSPAFTRTARWLENVLWLSPPASANCPVERSEEHTPELQSLMRISY